MAEDAAKPEGRRPVAFISHHSSQEKTARHLKNVLERNGVTGWMAPDDIEPGVAFDRAIIEQVERSDLIVLLFCSKSDQSRHVKREVMLAEDNNKLIYPVRLEDIDAKGLAYWLHDYQWIDWIDRRDATIQKMIETIKRQVGGTEAGAADKAEAPDKGIDEKTAAPGVSEGKAPPAEPPVPPLKTPASTAAPPPPPPPSAGAKPDAGDAKPMGLAGTVESAPGAAAPKRELPVSRNVLIGLGVGALLLAVIVGLVVNAMLGGESEFKVRPGQWATSYTVDRTLANTRASEAEAQEFISRLNALAITQCIYEDDARTPGDDFFDPEGGNNCTANSIEMDGGRFRAELQCFPDWLNGDRMDVWMRGTYEWERIEAESEYAIGAGSGREFRFVANETKTHIGACN